MLVHLYACAWASWQSTCDYGLCANVAHGGKARATGQPWYFACLPRGAKLAWFGPTLTNGFEWLLSLALAVCIQACWSIVLDRWHIVAIDNMSLAVAGCQLHS